MEKQKQKKQDKPTETPIDNVTVVDLDMHDADSQTELDKTLNTLTDVKQIRSYTHLSGKEIRKLSILNSYGKKYKFQALLDVISEFMSQRVSYKRMGRKEIIDIYKGERQHQERMINAQGNQYSTPNR